MTNTIRKKIEEILVKALIDSGHHGALDVRDITDRLLTLIEQEKVEAVRERDTSAEGGNEYRRGWNAGTEFGRKEGRKIYQREYRRTHPEIREYDKKYYQRVTKKKRRLNRLASLTSHN